MSTTGFGDYRPISDAERFISAFMMIIGVAIFSFIISNYIYIIRKINTFDEDFVEGDKLTLFISTLQYFNKNIAIN